MVIVFTTLLKSEFALVVASHGYIIRAHMNAFKRKLLDNVMIEKWDLVETNIVKANTVGMVK